MIPYTPILTTAKTYKIPILISAICKAILRPNNSISEPQGITAQVIKLAVMANPGPKMNNHLLAAVGMISSFMINLIPSASGCNNPKGPALLGPGRSCKMAATFLSPKVVYKAIPKLPKTTTAIKINFSITSPQSNARIVMLI